MKKFGFLVPILILFISAAVAPRILASNGNPIMLIFVGIGMILLVTLIRPKKQATKTTMQVAEEVLDDFCKDAFAENDAVGTQFLAALNEIGKNMPKSAVVKLQKLEPQCTTDQQKYAVAMASAQAYLNSRDWKNLIREYNKAIVLNPTDTLAYKIGDCYQRLGRLDKARDSYEFAIELNPQNPQYVSSLGTLCVGEGDYDSAIDYALDALDLDPKFPQALATLAICYGVKRDSIMHKRYLELAVENGYSQEKIESTIKALKK